MRHVARDFARRSGLPRGVPQPPGQLLDRAPAALGTDGRGRSARAASPEPPEKRRSSPSTEPRPVPRCAATCPRSCSGTSGAPPPEAFPRPVPVARRRPRPCGPRRGPRGRGTPGRAAAPGGVRSIRRPLLRTSRRGHGPPRARPRRRARSAAPAAARGRVPPPADKGLRLHRPAAMVTWSWDDPPRRAQGHRDRTATGTPPLDRRTNDALPRRLPPTPPSPRTQSHPPPRLHRPRPPPHPLPQTTKRDDF